MKSREIDLKLGAPYTEGAIAIPGVSVLKAKGYGVKLAVDTAQAPIDMVVGELLRTCAVEDITIQNPPMEEIIAAIYRERSEPA
jgi:ABC-2 type transport system ATP-binding protein